MTHTYADFRLATCNARKELGPAGARTVVNQAAARADIVVWQEIESAAHMGAVSGLAGFTTYWPGGRDKAGHLLPMKKGPGNATPISWRTDQFRVVFKANTRLYKGRSGVSYSRYLVWVVLEDRATGLRIPVVNTHMVAQAWTSRISRRPLWNTSAKKVEARVRTILANYGAIVGGGDMNRNRWAPNGTQGVWTHHGTCGGAHYDTLYRAGRIQVVGVPSRIETASDHDILTATFRRTR